MKLYRVIWDTRAKESLKAIVLYIKEESPTAAKKVRSELLKLTASLKKCRNDFQQNLILSIKEMNTDPLRNGVTRLFTG